MRKDQKDPFGMALQAAIDEAGLSITEFLNQIKPKIGHDPAVADHEVPELIERYPPRYDERYVKRVIKGTAIASTVFKKATREVLNIEPHMDQAIAGKRYQFHQRNHILGEIWTSLMKGEEDIRMTWKRKIKTLCEKHSVSFETFIPERWDLFNVRNFADQETVEKNVIKVITRSWKYEELTSDQRSKKLMEGYFREMRDMAKKMEEKSPPQIRRSAVQAR